MAALQRLLLVLLGLMLLGGLAFLLAAWMQRWPRVSEAWLRLGNAVVNLGLGLLGLWIVVLVLRSFGWLPPAQ